MKTNQKIQLKAIHDLWPHLKPWQRKWLRIQCEVIYGIVKIIDLIYRVDLWLLPPLAFYSTYITAQRNFPAHPISEMAVLSTAFMAMTLTLFLIRPRKWLRIVRWVKA